MIESNNPEINVEKLMQKIREEVDKGKNQNQQPLAAVNSNAGKLNFNFNYIEALIQNAEKRAFVRTKLPEKLNRFSFPLSNKIKQYGLKIFNFIFRDQREVNFNLISALKQSIVINRQLIKEIENLRLQLNDYSSNNENTIQSLNSQIDELKTGISHVDKQFNELDSGISQLDELSKKLSTDINQINRFDQRLNEINTDVKSLKDSYLHNDIFIKNDLGQQKRLITMLLEQARQRLPETLNQEESQYVVKQEKHLTDAFYVAFEDKFRGTRENILNRLKVYLPLIEDAKIGTPEKPILDVGCGRGEWLELLRESGYTARGIDINKVMIEQCLSRGLDVIESDVILYLQSFEDNSLGAISGFHIIEHLPFETLMTLFAEAIRVIKPGGLIIFETPNPENVIVGSYSFYSDPTHRNPLPSPTIKFVAEYYGLKQVKIMNLNPYPKEFMFSGSDVEKCFEKYFYGAQDYAVIGFKS
ncbi:methylase involved in ubiquinone/menaquinone biosynthesis [Rivularia sp. PCC 7116]|uniref:class I SAM-dependent methyltransferase n=1 Tax=Rivularia sp. PCC 7116 TaxID=373994 RepID=UPI00029EC9B9|nr:class I SAM-dependent methyltransferase [Rivularia sp. PCC 7116]AFY58272.1 methylase involved in ubiquinone/menaquinone biosynthesis [Rivularia sp. PCC 7116]